MKKTAKAPSATQQKVSMPAISKAQAPAIFEKLITAAKSYDAAWSMVRKAFPRKQWGKVRDIVQALSKHKTLRAAYDAAHSSGKKGVKVVAKKSAKKSPVAKEAIRQAA